MVNTQPRPVSDQYIDALVMRYRSEFNSTTYRGIPLTSLSKAQLMAALIDATKYGRSVWLDLPTAF